MKYKIGVIGKQDAVLPFRMMGLETFSPKGEEALRNLILKLVRENFGVLYITEDYARQIPDVISHYDKELVPAFIPIPSLQVHTGLGKQRINKMGEKAVGQNILS